MIGVGADAGDLKNDGKQYRQRLTYGWAIVRIATALSNSRQGRCEAACTHLDLSLDNQWGEQAQPLVDDGVMYVTDAKATVAIDIETGKQMWRRPSIAANR